MIRYMQISYTILRLNVLKYPDTNGLDGKVIKV